MIYVGFYANDRSLRKVSVKEYRRNETGDVAEFEHQVVTSNNGTEYFMNSVGKKIYCESTPNWL
jgi:hypothetical protein